MCSENKLSDADYENERTELTETIDGWSLHFDGSKCKEGAGAGCILTDPKGNKNLIACRLEFECTNNTAEYEAL